MPELFLFPTKKADNENRTRLPSLGSWYSTDELYPHERIILFFISVFKGFLNFFPSPLNEKLNSNTSFYQ